MKWRKKMKIILSKSVWYTRYTKEIQWTTCTLFAAWIKTVWFFELYLYVLILFLERNLIFYDLILVNQFYPFFRPPQTTHTMKQLIYFKCWKETLLQKFMTNLCLQSLNIFITSIKHRLYELYAIYCCTRDSQVKK